MVQALLIGGSGTIGSGLWKGEAQKKSGGSKNVTQRASLECLTRVMSKKEKPRDGLAKVNGEKKGKQQKKKTHKEGKIICSQSTRGKKGKDCC